MIKFHEKAIAVIADIRREFLQIELKKLNKYIAEIYKYIVKN